MRIHREEGVRTIDLQGTIMFTINDCCIRIDDKECDLHISNGTIVGMGNNGFINRIRQCITLYKFLKA